MVEAFTRRMTLETGICICVSILLISVVLYVSGCNSTLDVIKNNISFHDKLSEYRLFEARMSDLIPEKGVETFEIALPLFTKMT